LVSKDLNKLAFRTSPQKMAPVTTQTANAQTTHHKKTRRGLGKKKQARTVSDVDMAVDEDSALTTNNKEGIISLLDPSCSSPSQALPLTTSAQQAAAASAIDKSTQHHEDDEEMLLDTSPPTAPPATKNGDISAGFSPLPAATATHCGTKKSEIRRIPIPPHRMSPLKKDWVNIFAPLTEMCGLQVRMNVHRRTVEIRVSTFYYFAGNMHSKENMLKPLSFSRHRRKPRRSEPSKRVPTLLKHMHWAST
jgi:RNA-binding protein PNO1